MNNIRYAIYWAPPADSAFWQDSSRWLGRDCRSGQCFGAPDDLDSDAWERLTATPRKYGLHATLKAPFRLQEDCQPDDLAAQCAAFARGKAPFQIDGLEISRLGGFIAVRPARQLGELIELADDCVTEFDVFRAPMPTAELARRRASGLSREQEENLVRWGYPHVFLDYRFHLTLTDNLPPAESNRWLPRLAERLGPSIPASAYINAISLFRQSAPDQAFDLIEDFPFGGAV